MTEPHESARCRIVCIISDPDTGRGYYCDSCPLMAERRSAKSKLLIASPSPMERDR